MSETNPADPRHFIVLDPELNDGMSTVWDPRNPSHLKTLASQLKIWAEEQSDIESITFKLDLMTDDEFANIPEG